MKRKPASSSLPSVVDPKISDLAKASAVPDKGKYKVVRCTVCAMEMSSPTSSESMCWICRRLKISAWRDADNQLSAAE